MPAERERSRAEAALLRNLRDALERWRIDSRVDIAPVGCRLAVPVLNVIGAPIRVHVEFAFDASYYVWDRGQRRQPAEEVASAASRLASHVRHLRYIT